MPNDPDNLFSDLHHEAGRLCDGARLFTISVFDRAAGLAYRAYTSHPGEYPVTGTKPVQEDAWFDRVVVQGKPFVANTTAEFAGLFPDHTLINSLGCEAVVNLPVRAGQQVIGTVNVLDRAGQFTPTRVAALEALIERHTPALVAAMTA